MKKHVHSKCVHPPFRAHPWLCGFFVALTVLLPGCEHQTGRAGSFSTTSEDGPPRIWYWETRTDVSVVGSQLCEPLEQDTNKGVYTCRVPVLRGSSDEPVILAVSEGEALEVKRWDFPDEWDPPGWPFQLEHSGNTVGDIHLSRTEDVHQQVVPLHEIQWRLAWDADDPPPLEAWVVFRVATSAGGDPLEVAMYYDGTLEQPWQEAGGEGESTSHCAGQRSGGGTSEVPCYLPAPPLGGAYEVEVWLRGADRAVEETISLSRTGLVTDHETPLRCPGMTEGPYTLYYPVRNGNANPSGAVAACDELSGYAPNSYDCPDEECETPPLLSEVDLDLDGFSPAQGDCNDYDPLIHPGAEDPTDDSIDQDCGGLDGPQPHVGLNERSAASVQAALDAAPNEPVVTVWVGPGTYLEYEVTFRGKALRLKSTNGLEKTIINARQQGTVMVFDNGETEETVLEGFTISGGKANSAGGGIYLEDSSPVLTNLTVTGNEADYGGGMLLNSSSPVLTSVTFTRNEAYTAGGAMYTISSTLVLTNVTIIGNEADSNGGGMYLYDSSPVLTNVTLTSNEADYGGGMYLSSSSPVLTHVTLTGNEAYYSGGGMYLDYSSPTLHNCILAYNTGLNLVAYNNQPELSYTNLYNPYGGSHNLPVLPSTVTELDPGFVAFSNDGDASNDDLHLRPSSPLIDAGDPSGCESSDSSGCDPDGSLPDLGALGGAGADFTYYADSDADTLYDGWELAQVGDLATLDGNTDTDGDELSDKGELDAGTNPTTADSDGDGFSDGQEVSVEREPLNPSSVPGVEGLVRLEVPSSLYPTVQAALNTIPTGKEGSVRLAPGTYRENLILVQKRVVLEGAGEGLTVLDGLQTGSVIRAGDASLELSGLTVRNGNAEYGGGIYLSFAAGSITNVTLTDNEADYGGGGMALISSSPVLTNVTLTTNKADYGGGIYTISSRPVLTTVTIISNEADSNGGGMYLYDSSPVLTNVTLTSNRADYGGGMCLESSGPGLTNVTLTGNEALSGGGMYLESSSSVLTMVTLTRNEADYGGGMYLSSSSPVLTSVTLTSNEAYTAGGAMYTISSRPGLTNVTLTSNEALSGGGMYLESSSSVLTNVTILGNEADYGGGMYLSSSSPVLTNVTLTGNEASYPGGGMYLDDSSPTLHNCILAYNTGLNLVAYNNQPELSYTNLYNPYGGSHNLPGLPSTVLELDPGFVAFSNDGDASNDDLHLRPFSPLIDAGDPSGCGSSDSSGCDPDGSLPDLGAFGGNGADFSYYTDSDADTLYDGWELAQSGDLATLDGNTDADGDELSDKGELDAGTNSTMADSDGDGFSDGQEVSDERDPLNPFSVPGVEGLVRLEVPSSLYPTVQSALNVIPTGKEGSVRLAPGTYWENLILSQKRVVLEGAGEGLTVLDGMQTGSVIRAGNASLELSGLTVRNGNAEYGGGIHLSAAAGGLTNVTFTGNEADYGGGMYLYDSSPVLTNVTLTSSEADYGGGLYLESSSPVLTNVTLTSNEADYGGGLYLSSSSPVMTNVTLTSNEAISGGGMYLESSSPVLTNVTILDNEAIYFGGGMRLSSSSPTLTNVTLTGNEANSGGGMYLNDSIPTLLNCILAYNTGLNLNVRDSQPVLSYTNLYNPYGGSHNLTVLPSTVTELDPGFVAFSSDGDASNDDLHLRPSSPLIDAGDPSACGSSDSSGCDPDGSLPDLGALGGAGADFTYYADSDADTLYDGWELAQAGDLATLDGNTDTDGDELNDKGELDAGTNPTTADSDGDGYLDGQEVSDGRDPLNPCSVPGVEGLVRLEVPSSLYPTVQSALDAIPMGKEGSVRLAPGTYRENLILSQKRVVLEGAGESLTVLDGMQTGSVIRANTATLELSGVTVRNGNAVSHSYGGGIYLTASAGSMTNVTLTGNRADYSGGGMFLYGSSPTLTNVTLTGNEAVSGGGMYLDYSSPTLTNATLTGNAALAGGGMYLSSSSPVLTNVTLTGNTASRDGGGMGLNHSSPVLTNVTLTGNTASQDGGGMYLNFSSPGLTSVTLTNNEADYGGGMYLNFSSPALTSVTLTSNEAAYSDGGGIYMLVSSPVLTNVTLAGNEAYSDGGGMFLEISSPVLTNVTLAGNEAYFDGGGMYILGSSPTLTNVTLADNEAAYGGGGMFLSSSSPVVTNVSLTGNGAYSGGGMSLSSSSPVLTNVTLTGNTAYYGGGMFLYYSSPVLHSSVVAYNIAESWGNLGSSIVSTLTANRCAFYNPPSFGTDPLTPTGTYLTVEPEFLAYSDSISGASCTPGSSTSCLPSNLHLALGSPLINAGDSSLLDPDGSLSDIGSYGGPEGDAWDLDGDRLPDYFWPGTWNDAPKGFTSTDYDCDDLDPTVGGCP